MEIRVSFLSARWDRGVVFSSFRFPEARSRRNFHDVVREMHEAYVAERGIRKRFRAGRPFDSIARMRRLQNVSEVGSPVDR